MALGDRSSRMLLRKIHVIRVVTYEICSSVCGLEHDSGTGRGQAPVSEVHAIDTRPTVLNHSLLALTRQ